MGLEVELPAIGRLRAQDSAAFGLLVDAHYGRVQRYLARLLGDAETAADLTQETFLRAYAALPRLADDSDLAGWLFRIAINLARQHHRRHRLVCWARLPRGEADPAHPRLLEDDVLQQDQIRHALDRLSLDQRSCLLLYAWTGYTCAEIGEIVGRSPDAVRMLMVRARRRFRSAYAAYAAYGDGLDSIDRGHSGDGEAYGSDDAGRTGRGDAPPSVTSRGGNRTAGAAGTAAAKRSKRCSPSTRAAISHATASAPSRGTSRTASVADQHWQTRRAPTACCSATSTPPATPIRVGRRPPHWCGGERGSRR
jgi:RNA polymerase sigma-70 factor (ECF subfamily)